MPAVQRTRSFFLLPLCLALAVTLSCAAHAASVDADYETITPASHSVPAPVASDAPPSVAFSPLVIPDHPCGPHPRMRFVMRDGTVLIGQVLAFDGQMYSLWSAHSTLLVRKDLFVSITPLPAAAKIRPAAGRLRPTHGTGGL